MRETLEIEATRKSPTENWFVSVVDPEVQEEWPGEKHCAGAYFIDHVENSAGMTAREAVMVVLRDLSN